LGAQAEYAEVDYGWIEPGTVLCESPAGPLSYVCKFWEKPSHHQAETLLNRGCVWNTFVTLGRATVFFELCVRKFPSLFLPYRGPSRTRRWNWNTVHWPPSTFHATCWPMCRTDFWFYMTECQGGSTLGAPPASSIPCIETALNQSGQ
jgi:mannose-1-phosphate guanylyltransferase